MKDELVALNGNFFGNIRAFGLSEWVVTASDFLTVGIWRAVIMLGIPQAAGRNQSESGRACQ